MSADASTRSGSRPGGAEGGSGTRKHSTFCRICEATCGLNVEVEGNQVVRITGDKQHVASQGYACVKGIRFGAVQHNPDRVLHPLKRTDSGWRRISWDDALDEIGGKVRRLIDRYGDQTVSYFMGSPAGTSIVNPIFRQAFFDGIGTLQRYGVGSVDCNNKFRVADDMFGFPFFVPFPDIDHADFVLLVGTNPSVSQASLFHFPRSVKRLRAITERGGRVVHLNPRRTETAEAVGEHVFIRPDTDVWFLAAFLRELIHSGGIDDRRVAEHTSGFDELRALVDPWTPERAEEVTGVPADTIVGLARAHRAADGAALYMSTGVNQGTHGSLCYWLLESINVVTGNLDRRGGVLMGKGINDWPAYAKKQGMFTPGPPTTIGDAPMLVDSYPAAVLADHVLAPEGTEGKVSALVVEASNPALNIPSPGGRFEEALRSLELLVSIDLFRNETGNFAHYVLPTPTFLERADVPYALQTFAGNQPVRHVYYADPVLEAPPDVREEWWIYTRLAEAAGVTLFGNRLGHRALQLNAQLYASRRGRRLALDHGRMISLILKRSKLPGGRALRRKHPHGLLLEPNRPGDFFGEQRVLTDDGRVQLAPPPLVADAARLEAEFGQEVGARRAGRLKLISKRELRSMNSWLRNAEEYRPEPTNYLYVHPDDARSLGLSDGGSAQVANDHGSLEIPVRVTDEVMVGTVAIPHGWGHAPSDGLAVAQAHAGVNTNVLAGDGTDHMERLSGISHLSGILVDVRPVGDRSAPKSRSTDVA